MNIARMRRVPGGRRRFWMTVVAITTAAGLLASFSTQAYASHPVKLKVTCTTGSSTSVSSGTTNGGTSIQIAGTPRIRVGAQVSCLVESLTETFVGAAVPVKFAGPTATSVPRTDTFTAIATGNGSITYTVTNGHGTLTLKFLYKIVP